MQSQILFNSLLFNSNKNNCYRMIIQTIYNVQSWSSIRCMQCVYNLKTGHQISQRLRSYLRLDCKSSPPLEMQLENLLTCSSKIARQTSRTSLLLLFPCLFLWYIILRAKVQIHDRLSLFRYYNLIFSRAFFLVTIMVLQIRYNNRLERKTNG